MFVITQEKYESFDLYDSMVLHRNIKKDVFFCLAVNMLDVADLKDVLAQAGKMARDMDKPDKTDFIEWQLHECAENEKHINTTHFEKMRRVYVFTFLL